MQKSFEGLTSLEELEMDFEAFPAFSFEKLINLKTVEADKLSVQSLLTITSPHFDTVHLSNLITDFPNETPNENPESLRYQFQNLRKVKLVSIEMAEAKRFLSLIRRNVKLETVDIEFSSKEGVKEEDFPDLWIFSDSLKNLNVKGRQFIFPANKVEDLKTLRELKLEPCSTSNLATFSTFRNLSKLKLIFKEGEESRTVSKEDLLPLGSLTSLKKLTIANARIRDFTPLVPLARSITDLKWTLALEYDLLTFTSFLRTFTNLTSLALNSIPGSKMTVETVGTLNRLKYLELNFCDFGEFKNCNEIFEGLKPLQSTVSLTVSLPYRNFHIDRSFIPIWKSEELVQLVLSKFRHLQRVSLKGLVHDRTLDPILREVRWKYPLVRISLKEASKFIDF